MKKEHVLFLLCGAILGLIAGTLFLGPLLVRKGVLPGPAQTAAASPVTPGPAGGPANPMQQVLAQIDVLKKRLAANPKDAEAAFQLGNMYMDARKWDQAIGYYEQGLSVADHPDVRTDLGICYRAKGDSARALAIFREVQKRAPDHFQARFNEAVALVDLEKIAEARRIVEELKKERPEDPDVQKFVNVLGQLKG